MVPAAYDSVARVPGVVLFNVTRLPAVPETENPYTVVVDPAGNKIVDGAALEVISAKVFAPDIVSAPAPP